MFLPVLLWAVFLGVAYQACLALIRHEEIAVPLVTVIFWLSVYLFERSFVKWMGLTGTLLIYVGGAALLLDRWLLQQPAVSGRSGRTPGCRCTGADAACRPRGALVRPGLGVRRTAAQPARALSRPDRGRARRRGVHHHGQPARRSHPRRTAGRSTVRARYFPVSPPSRLLGASAMSPAGRGLAARTSRTSTACSTGRPGWRRATPAGPARRSCFAERHAAAGRAGAPSGAQAPGLAAADRSVVGGAAILHATSTDERLALHAYAAQPPPGGRGPEPGGGGHRDPADITAARHEAASRRAIPSCCSSGRIHPIKRLDLLAEAFTRLARVTRPFTWSLPVLTSAATAPSSSRGSRPSPRACGGAASSTAPPGGTARRRRRARRLLRFRASDEHRRSPGGGDAGRGHRDLSVAGHRRGRPGAPGPADGGGHCRRAGPGAGVSRRGSGAGRAARAWAAAHLSPAAVGARWRDLYDGWRALTTGGQAHDVSGVDDHLRRP